MSRQSEASLAHHFRALDSTEKAAVSCAHCYSTTFLFLPFFSPRRFLHLFSAVSSSSSFSLFFSVSPHRQVMRFLIRRQHVFKFA